jgi:serine protease AprX
MASITINGITIDTAAPTATLAAFSFGNTSAEKSDYVLVQTSHPLTEPERNALRAAGAEILESVPESTLICHFPGTDLSALKALPFVAWVDLYPNLVKLSPSLRHLDAKVGGIPTRPRSPSTSSCIAASTPAPNWPGLRLRPTCRSMN